MVNSTWQKNACRCNWDVGNVISEKEDRFFWNLDDTEVMGSTINFCDNLLL